MVCLKCIELNHEVVHQGELNRFVPGSIVHNVKAELFVRVQIEDHHKTPLSASLVTMSFIDFNLDNASWCEVDRFCIGGFIDGAEISLVTIRRKRYAFLLMVGGGGRNVFDLRFRLASIGRPVELEISTVSSTEMELSICRD